MGKYGLKVGSVTYAMKGRDLLQKNGYKVSITRNPHPGKDEGCGYIIIISNMDCRCMPMLNNAGIKVYGTIEMGGQQ